MENDEEWNNFMQRVQDISKLISGLASEDKETVDKSIALSDRYLSEGTLKENEVVKIKNDRTVINQKAFQVEDQPSNSNTTKPEVFMKQVERDANQRAEAKKVSREKADTFKTRAIKAFRRQDYELALSCYNQAIDHVKDSCLLYTSRSLTLIKLNKYDQVIKDCEWALRLNSNSLKANLYLAKALLMLKDSRYDETRDNLLDKFPQHKELIKDFLKEDKPEPESNEEEINNSSCTTKVIYFK